MTTLGAMVVGLENNYRGGPLEAQLSGYGIPITRIPGVLVDDEPGGMDAHVDQAAARVLQRRELTKGEVGCALAQRNAWATLLASDSPYSLVFEDDARLTRHPVDEDLLRVLSDEKPVVVLFDSYSDYTVVSRWARPLGDVYRTIGSAPGTWAYAINRAAAEVLLEGRAPVASVTDWPARVAHKVAFHVTYPQRASVDEDVASSIDESRLQGEKESPESLATKLVRIVLTVTHVRMLQNKRAYRSYPAYVSHELRRLLVNALSRRLRHRLRPDDRRSPLSLP